MLYLAADHAGFALKEKIKHHLSQQGVVLQDLSLEFQSQDDYPEIAKRLSLEVRKRTMHRGILVCGSGGGASMVANKISGIRAGQAETPKTAKFLRADNDANVLCLGARVITPSVALQTVRVFLTERRSVAARHARRLRQLALIEKQRL